MKSQSYWASHDEIGHAKDAAAGAVLLASMFGSMAVAAMVLDWLLAG